MFFKTDKDFVTKVALHGFTAPQLLRKFCLRQNLFYGLRWHDIKGWEKVVLWFDGIREPAEGSNYW